MSKAKTPKKERWPALMAKVKAKYEKGLKNRTKRTK